MSRRRITESDFWDRVSIGSPNECWLWRKSLNKNGYGQLSFAEWTEQHGGATVQRAHVIAWSLGKNGGFPPPTGAHVHHTCENKQCCNPGHLVIASASDHMSYHGEERKCVHGDLDRNPTGSCRVCDRERNQRNREAARVPCRECGTLRLNQKHVGKRGNDTGLCRVCWGKRVNTFKAKKPAAA